MDAWGARHIVIPDVQLKSGVPVEHLEWMGHYIVDKRPDVLVIGGDWADMPSLSSYDKGKKSYEGRTYRGDILAANDGLQRLMAPIQAEMERIERRCIKRWKLRKIVVLGNHEDRINRAIEDARQWEHTISTDDIHFRQWGFEVYPFLQQVEVDGITYCHYFPSGPMNRPITTARALLSKLHASCFAFHQQGRDIAYGKKANGQTITAIICGSAYLHDEPYLGPQGNNVWRGIWMLNDVRNGSCEEMQISLKFLRRWFENRPAERAPHAGNFKPRTEREQVVVDMELPRPLPDSPGLPEAAA